MMFILEDLASGETLILLEEMEYDLTSFKNTKFTYVPDRTWSNNSTEALRKADIDFRHMYCYGEYGDFKMVDGKPVPKDEIEKIWDSKKGPFTEVVDGCMRRTPAGITALREEIAYHLSTMPSRASEKARGEFNGGGSWVGSSR